MIIKKPILPPKEGYVETVDENGNHTYSPTRSTRKKLKEADALQSSIDNILLDQEYRLALLEMEVN